MRRTAVVLITIVFLGCNPDRRATGTPTNEEPSASIAAQERPSGLRKVSFEHMRPEKPPTVAVRVLVDSSASMAGFKASLPQILAAVDQALSYSRDLYFRVESKETCFFAQKLGVACQRGIQGVTIRNATGYTNLDRAVAAAAEGGLAVILTDGVPAGRSSGEACVAAGVDAGCVAEALSDAIRGAPGAVRGRLRGVWVVPILTSYNGVYFAEQPILPRDFDGNRAETDIQSATGVNARVRNPRTSSDGTLIFDYLGPRYLLAIVIGEVEPGRAFLQELFKHSEYSQARVIQDVKAYKGGTAMLPPVELFPSSLPAQTFRGCRQKKDARGRLIGDLVNCSDAAPNRFVLSCRQKLSSAPLILPPAPLSDPMQMFLLAPVRFTFSGGRSIAGARIESVSSDGSNDLTLVVDAKCDAARPVRCGSTDGNVELGSVPDFATAISEMASKTSPAGQFLQSLSTRSPAVEPYKIYGFADLVENFYRRNLPAGQSPFSTLEFCQE